jgi:protein-disulfide isomerase
MAFTRPSKNDPQHLWTFLFFVAFGFTVYSIVLALISTFYIQSYCIMCILSYAVNLILLYLTWIVRKRFKCGSFYPAFKNDFKYILNRPRSLVAGILIFGSIILALFLFLPSYWELTAPTLSRNISTGVTSDGHPWIGADKPKLEIVEFSDYRCFQCKKMHFYLRKLISSYPDKIRLIHRHFPMDNVINPIVKKPFHKGTAKLAIFSMAAAEMGKFWEVNDLIYSIPRQANTVNFQKLAAKAGLDFQKIKPLLQDRNLWNRLIKDIKEGLKYKITGTPCFIINKQVYSGRIPPDVFRKHGIL